MDERTDGRPDGWMKDYARKMSSQGNYYFLNNEDMPNCFTIHFGFPDRG